MIFVKINTNVTTKKSEKERKRNSYHLRVWEDYFVANYLLGEWGSMQMTVISEGLLLNSKYIKIGRKKGGFQAFLTQPPLVIVCPAVSNGYWFTALRP